VAIFGMKAFAAIGFGPTAAFVPEPEFGHLA
jgi:hypothetical protein